MCCRPTLSHNGRFIPSLLDLIGCNKSRISSHFLKGQPLLAKWPMTVNKRNRSSSHRSSSFERIFVYISAGPTQQNWLLACCWTDYVFSACRPGHGKDRNLLLLDLIVKLLSLWLVGQQPKEEKKTVREPISYYSPVAGRDNVDRFSNKLLMWAPGPWLCVQDRSALSSQLLRLTNNGQC